MDMAVRPEASWPSDIVAVVTENTRENALSDESQGVTGEVACLEVALATPRGLDVIERLARADGFVVGVATSLNADAAKSALEAGTAFRLWPSLRREPMTGSPYNDTAAGASFPVQTLTALDGRTDIVKLFPVRTVCADYIEREVMPLPQRIFMPRSETSSVGRDSQVMVIGIGRHLSARSISSMNAGFLKKARRLIEAAQLRVSRLNTESPYQRYLQSPNFNHDRSTMPASLTSEQKCSLAELVAEHAGTRCSFSSFSDYLLLLLEDIPGFETATPGRALLREIWELYRTEATRDDAGNP